MEAEEKRPQADIRARFRARARSLRFLAYSVLLLICVTLGGGVYLFVIAGEIVSRESAESQRKAFEQARQILAEIAPETQNLILNLQRLAEINSQTGEEVQTLITEAAVTIKEIGLTAKELRQALPEGLSLEENERLISFFEILSSEETRLALEDTSRVVPEVLRNLLALTNELRTLSENAPATLDKFLASKASERMTTPILVSTLATRIGALLVLIFLVQILINLYRYNIRLAAFFDARADAMELLSSPAGASLNLLDLTAALSPDNLDFGKSPTSPTQHAVELAREIIARQPK